jgi:hypothetical protein
MKVPRRSWGYHRSVGPTVGVPPASSSRSRGRNWPRSRPRMRSVGRALVARCGTSGHDDNPRWASRGFGTSSTWPATRTARCTSWTGGAASAQAGSTASRPRPAPRYLVSWRRRLAAPAATGPRDRCPGAAPMADPDPAGSCESPAGEPGMRDSREPDTERPTSGGPADLRFVSLNGEAASVSHFSQDRTLASLQE